MKKMRVEEEVFETVAVAMPNQTGTGSAAREEQWPPKLPTDLALDAPIALFYIASEMTGGEKEANKATAGKIISQVHFTDSDRFGLLDAFYNFTQRFCGSERATVEAIARNDPKLYLKVLGVLYQIQDSYMGLTPEAQEFFRKVIALHSMYVMQIFEPELEVVDFAVLDEIGAELAVEFQELPPTARFSLAIEFPKLVSIIEDDIKREEKKAEKERLKAAMEKASAPRIVVLKFNR